MQGVLLLYLPVHVAMHSYSYSYSNSQLMKLMPTFLPWIFLQLRNTYNKLESDLSNSKKRYLELVEHRDNLKRGREDSVSCFVYCQDSCAAIMLTQLICIALLQEERESALEELKAVEVHHKKLKVPLYSLFYSVVLLVLSAAQQCHNNFRKNQLHMQIVIQLQQKQ